MTQMQDCVVLGAGMYGLYAALLLLKKGCRVALIEHDEAPFMRASYINQARIHYGYHYPRSYATAIKSAQYFDRFNRDFACAVNAQFKKIYAISSRYSLTNGEQFEKFCRNAAIPCRSVSSAEWFKPAMVDGVFETLEYAYDARIICDFLLEQIKAYAANITFQYADAVAAVESEGDRWKLQLSSGARINTAAVVNATYGSVNQVNELFGFQHFNIKYEICEIILGKPSANIADVGLTVMDGPFFSMMPFGKTGLHSLTAVTFTPHTTCYESLPTFKCQKANPLCTAANLENCNSCPARPQTAFRYMGQMAKKYLRDDIGFTYERSLFSIKPILASSELDDSRPTLVRELSTSPRFISALSGKINTVYDLEDLLQ